MSDWIEDFRLPLIKKWEPWANDAAFVLEDGNSEQHHWLNLATGARMVLIADGGWRMAPRSRFRLWAHYPGDGDMELTRLLEHNTLNDGRYQTDPELQGCDKYQRVEASCVAYVNQLLGLTPAQPTAPAEPMAPPTAEPQTREPGFIEGLIQRGWARRA